MKYISLSQGKFAIVDDEDFEYLNQWKWCLRGQYAGRAIYLGGGRKNQRSKNIYMHNLINKTLKGFETDHINQNKLDNRRSNLRSVTHQQNNCNKNLQVNNTSGLRGVTWNAQRNKWMAQIKANGRYYYLGLFLEKVVAADVYDKAAVKFFGSFSRPNL